MLAQQSSAPPQGRAPRTARRAQTRASRSETTLLCQSLTVVLKPTKWLRPAHLEYSTVCFRSHRGALRWRAVPPARPTLRL